MASLSWTACALVTSVAKTAAIWCARSEAPARGVATSFARVMRLLPTLAAAVPRSLLMLGALVAMFFILLVSFETNRRTHEMEFSSIKNTDRERFFAVAR